MQLARAIREEGEVCGLQPLRVAFLSSYSFEFVEPRLLVEGARSGLLLRTYYGPFGHFEQELAGLDSGLAGFDPELLVLAMRLEDVDPDALLRFHATQGARFDALVEEVLERLTGLVDAFRARSSAPVLVGNFAPQALAPLGIFDANEATSLTHRLAEANRRLGAALADRTDAIVWDYAGLVRNRGAAEWTDRRLMALARTPVAGAQQPALARHLVRTLCALLRPPAKCLVLDLDNTLWGGAIGDEGLEGIALGDDHPGVAYKAFQRAAMALRDRGILLAVASKNDLGPVEQVFREHPEMLIRWSDLAASRISWGPKSVALREIAAELNLGADALVFFDDNPVERAEVRIGAPEVRVVEVPRDPLRYVEALAECGEFDTVSLTQEDRGRADLYRQEGERQRLERSAGSLEEFLVSLEMRAAIGHAGPATLQRIAQLVGKTNQFNLTTRRHPAAEIQAMAEDPDHLVAWLRLRDRYGDAGLVVVGILRRDGTTARIDTLLMSCRVMGRQVERAFLAYLVEEARALGCSQLHGDYLPTAKNSVVKGLYSELGFTQAENLPDGGCRYALDLDAGAVAWPKLIGRDVDAAPDGSGPGAAA